jgi:hypothetical protein
LACRRNTFGLENLRRNIEGLILITNLVSRASFLFALLLYSQVRGQSLHFDFVAEANVGGQPESVIGDQSFLYASNMGVGENPFLKDGNGYISKLSYDGTVLDQDSITLAGGLDAPTGMALLDNQLFVADLDEVIGFDLDGQAPPTRIDLRPFGVSFLNDLVAVSDRHLVVSATNVKKLFLVDTVAQSTTALQLDFTLDHPNGLAFDERTGQLYIAANKQHTIGATTANGEILKLNLDVVGNSASFVSQAQNAGFFLDGISLLGDDQLIYSDWVSFGNPTGLLRRVDLDNLEPSAPTHLDLKGFADFHWQPNRHILAAPNLVEGKVRILRLAIPEPSTLVVAALAFGLTGRRSWRASVAVLERPRIDFKPSQDIANP